MQAQPPVLTHPPIHAHQVRAIQTLSAPDKDQELLYVGVMLDTLEMDSRVKYHLVSKKLFVSIQNWSLILLKITSDPCSPSPCDSNAQCTRAGTTGFTCRCNTPYVGNGFSCQRPGRRKLLTHVMTLGCFISQTLSF